MMYKKSNIAGVVILYNSERQVINNINSYLNQIDQLYIIDNSERADYEIVQDIKILPNATYIDNGENLGIAYALNYAAKMAMRDGYKFLLTMDDDTFFPADGIEKMLLFINQFSVEKLGIVAGQYNPRFFDNTIKTVPYTITSGSLLNLSAYEQCGLFMEELFIDFVDHEYCFRLNKFNYEIIEINNVHLNHNLGSKKQLTVFGYELPIYWRSHNPLRVYYKIRNSIFTLNKYETTDTKVKYIFYKDIFKDLLKILFFEDKKRTRIKLFIKGFHNGLKGNLGKRTFKI